MISKSIRGVILAAAVIAAGAAWIHSNGAGPALAEAPSASYKVTLKDNSVVEIVPYKEPKKAGLSDARCGVLVADQKIETLGSGDTDTYICNGFVVAGALPEKDGVERIGLIYDAASPNAEFRTAVILFKGDDGWKVDVESLGEFDDTDAALSIEALANAAK